jgi:hypothetical protein
MHNRSSITKGAAGGADLPGGDRAADRPRDHQHGGEFNPAAADAVHVVKRHCTICDWEAELVEKGLGNDPLCPWCFGPTERTEILGTVIPGDTGDKDILAASLGRRGGLKGGPARAQKLSAKRRKEIASKAARARWNKTKNKKK